ncbi:hypothetical protein BGZ63DRAFT_401479 [Mariannaea sp. PMI_226]|nr:hypothetical protein BGZ63DRAFT_401479 [Mariannaea sp. PMI_226]
MAAYCPIVYSYLEIVSRVKATPPIDMELPPSQASSHFSIEPIPASVLAERETKRRDAAVALGLCRTGCPKLDQYVLLGGLERGSVVGLSAEDEEVGVQLGLQTLAHALCSDERVTSGLIVTPKPAVAILGVLREAVRAELRVRGITDADAAAKKTRECLERVMLSCVFDLDGLWEVLADLDRPVADENEPAEARGNTEEKMMTKEKQQQQEQEKKDIEIEEIADSQDEDDELLSPSPEVEPQRKPSPKPSRPQLPDIIIATHFSSLLTGLFTHREKSAAHDALHLVGAHIRDLSRNLSSQPLILLLNSTSTSAHPNINLSTAATSTTTAAAPPPPPPPPPEHALQPRGSKKHHALDPTLRSIFNPPPPPGYAGSVAWPRRNKPSFGLVFAQLLDMHLLCTRLPWNGSSGDDGDTEATEAALQHGTTARSAIWVTEVLFDQMGFWEGTRGPRRNREQRWTALNVEGGRVKDVVLKT